APWRVANLYLPSEPVRLGLGKKDGCTVTIAESPMPSGDVSSDEYWGRLWYARTNLPPRGVMQVRSAPGPGPWQLQDQDHADADRPIRGPCGSRCWASTWRTAFSAWRRSSGRDHAPDP